MLYEVGAITSIQALFSYVFNNTPFGLMLLIAVLVITFQRMKKYDNLTALVPAAFITWLTSIALFIMSLAADYYVTAFGILFGVSVVLMWVRDKR